MLKIHCDQKLPLKIW